MQKKSISNTPPSVYRLFGSFPSNQQGISCVAIAADNLEAAKLAAADYVTSATTSADLLDATGRLLAIQQGGQWLDIDSLSEDHALDGADPDCLENLVLARMRETLRMLDGLCLMRQALDGQPNTPPLHKAVA